VVSTAPKPHTHVTMAVAMAAAATASLDMGVVPAIGPHLAGAQSRRPGVKHVRGASSPVKGNRHAQRRRLRPVHRRRGPDDSLWPRVDLPQARRACEFLALCQGGDPKHHRPMGLDPQRVNHFCKGYRPFFSRAPPELRRIAEYIARAVGPSIQMISEARSPVISETVIPSSMSCAPVFAQLRPVRS